ncbi:hypothetical protein I2F27_03635 [Acinetobacter sp. B5B]|uniref:hypothetical protein n=1 Tax=Acinetobacter baretiae TaxID=2605383 RepID=UPI0018C1E5FA|nr:hypothetical protein [Acinetobacter baretiae]MBF7682423.1 hypothetical protein [Acinetobacter baretiae]MBF7685309.1 hypothetical protein [Acinetobacter baretiae]
MKTVVKYILLKSKEYQLGHALYEDEIDASSHYFDEIATEIEYQHRSFKVLSKELNRKKIYDEHDAIESQTIVIKVVPIE